MPTSATLQVTQIIIPSNAGQQLLGLDSKKTLLTTSFKSPERSNSGDGSSDEEIYRISIEPFDSGNFGFQSVPLGSASDAFRALQKRDIELDEIAWHLVRSIHFSARSYSLRFRKTTPVFLDPRCGPKVTAEEVYWLFEEKEGCFRCVPEDALAFVLFWNPRPGQVVFVGSDPMATYNTGILRYVFGYGCLWDAQRREWVRLLFGSSLSWLTIRDSAMSWAFLTTR